METFTDSIRLAPGVYLQASPQKFRLHRLLPWDVALCIETLQETGDTRVTRQMMAGAFYAGFQQRASEEKIADEYVTATAPSVLRYIHLLAGAYQRMHATPPPCAVRQNVWLRAVSTTRRSIACTSLKKNPATTPWH